MVIIFADGSSFDADLSIDNKARVFATLVLENEAPVIDFQNTQFSVDEMTNFSNSFSATDPESDPLTYTWKQITGTTVNFTGSDGELAFDAPDVRSDETLEFELSISDGYHNLTETIMVTVLKINQAPTVDDISNFNMDERTSTRVSVDSSDADGDSVTTEVRIVSGENALSITLNDFILEIDANAVQTDQTVVIEYTVSDGEDSVVGTFEILVKNTDVPVQAEQSSSGGSKNLFSVLILGLFVLFRRYLLKAKISA
jgi:hypothetical protein